MIRANKLNFISNNKKKIRFFSFFFFLSFSFLIGYLMTPKLLNFSIDSIKKNLKDNNNININSISKVDYKIFPTPRLSIIGSNFTIGDEVFEVSNSELEIILNLSQILNFKEVNYKKILVKKGSSKINLNNIYQLLNIIKQNKKKLTIQENNLIFFQKNNFFFEIRDALIDIGLPAKKEKLKVKGSFLNNKIFIKLDNVLENKYNLSLEIPELDIAARIFLGKDNLSKVNGFFNLEVFNNFLKFNFIKDDGIKLTKGFIRSKIINTSLDGTINFMPNFFSKLNFNTSVLNVEKMFPLIKKLFFSDSVNNFPLIKKINGSFNFKSKFEGTITNENGEVLLKNFKVGKNKSYFFSAKIIEFGKKGKVQFNLTKIVKYKKNLPKKIEIIGFLIPSTAQITFEKFLLNDKVLQAKKTKEYENKFQNRVITNSLANIFNQNKINKYFKNLL
jgi:hypothetical protein